MHTWSKDSHLQVPFEKKFATRIKKKSSDQCPFFLKLMKVNSKLQKPTILRTHGSQFDLTTVNQAIKRWTIKQFPWIKNLDPGCWHFHRRHKGYLLSLVGWYHLIGQLKVNLHFLPNCNRCATLIIMATPTIPQPLSAQTHADIRYS